MGNDMSQLQDRIAQFRKMANDDPDNELGHYRLGQLLQEAGAHEDAIASFRRTLDLSPQFSKVYQLLAQSLQSLGQKQEAVETLKKGFQVADERGDRMPRDAMGQMLVELGEKPPQPAAPAPVADQGAGPGGFRCARTMCAFGKHANKLDKPPFGDELGRLIYDKVCAGCWNEWFRNYGTKVINELRLDLSTDRGQAEYDRHMKEFFNLES
jgi:Fe-S cluster biosynthesis and repair protein YggX